MRDQLLESASGLNQPALAAAQEFSQKRDQMAAMGNQRLADRPDLVKLVGDGNQLMAQDNNRNLARFMESVFLEYHPQVFVQTVIWVFRAYRSHGFQTTYWPANLNLWVDMIKEELSQESYAEIYPFFHWLIVNIPVFVKLSDEPTQSSQQVPSHSSI